MNWKNRILVAFPMDPQRSHRSQAAIRQIEDAIVQLGSLGFPLHVVEGPDQTVYQEYPKVVFHLRAGERIVQCKEELAELGPDWYDSMEAARHSAGMTKQMQRGGIFDKALPSMPVPPDLVAKIAAQEEDRRRTREYAEQMRAEHRSRGNGVKMPGTNMKGLQDDRR